MPKKAKRIKPPTVKPAWPAADKARIERLVVKWRNLLLLNGYEIIIRFEEKQKGDDPHVAADIDCNYPYRSGYVIRFWPQFLVSKWPERERKIIHELVHVITQPMKVAAHDLVSEKLVLWRDIKDRDETMVDWIATILHLSLSK